MEEGMKCRVMEILHLLVQFITFSYVKNPRRKSDKITGNHAPENEFSARQYCTITDKQTNSFSTERKLTHNG